jgi:hypothetical protein
MAVRETPEFMWMGERLRTFMVGGFVYFVYFVLGFKDSYLI